MLTLKAGDLEATFVPEAGMIGTSLKHQGDELLGQRAGLDAYISERKTMGIPLLHPWANRLSRRQFTLAGRQIDIDPARTPLRLDGTGLPMHGLLGAARGWEVEHHDDTRLTARFDFGVHEALMATFPFAHVLWIDVTLGDALMVTTTIEAAEPVPIAFGFHPYLQLPNLPREQWVVEVPVTEQLELDPTTMLPTGKTHPVSIERGALGAGTFDDAYTAPAGPFALEGGGRRVELAFVEGYPYSQVFAPPGDSLIAFEPMTAPTNALVDGTAPLATNYRATFMITVR